MPPLAGRIGPAASSLPAMSLVSRLARRQWPPAPLRLDRLVHARDFHPTPAVAAGESLEELMRKAREAEERKREEDKQREDAERLAAEEQKKREAEKDSEWKAIQAHWIQKQKEKEAEKEAERKRAAGRQQRIDKRIKKTVQPIEKQLNLLTTQIKHFQSEAGRTLAAIRSARKERASRKKLEMQKINKSVACFQAVEKNVEDLLLEGERLGRLLEIIREDIRKATEEEAKARAKRAEDRETITDWKALVHGYRYNTTGMLQWWRDVRPKQDRLKGKLALVDKKMQEFDSTNRHIQAELHVLGGILEYSRYFSYPDGGLWPRLKMDLVFRSFIDGMTELTSDVKDQLFPSFDAYVKDAPTRSKKNAAIHLRNSLKEVYRLCIENVIIGRCIRLDLTKIVHGYEWICLLKVGSLADLRAFKILEPVDRLGRDVASSHAFVGDYLEFLHAMDWEIPPAELRPIRSQLSKALGRLVRHWPTVRFNEKRKLDEAVRRCSEELADSGEIDGLREHLTKDVIRRLEQAWEPARLLDTFTLALLKPHTLNTILRSFPHQYIEEALEFVRERSNKNIEWKSYYERNKRWLLSLLEGAKKRNKAAIEPLQESINEASGQTSIPKERSTALQTGSGNTSRPANEPNERNTSLQEDDNEVKDDWLREASIYRPPRYSLVAKSEWALRLQIPPGRPIRFTSQLYQVNVEDDTLEERPDYRTYWTNHAAARSIRSITGKIVGFDMAWNAEAKPEDGIPANVSVISLSQDRRVSFYHVAMLQQGEGRDPVPHEMRLLLESPDVIKCGVGIKEKCERLRAFLGIEPQGFVDLSDMYNELCELDPKRPVPRSASYVTSPLRSLAERLLGSPVITPPHAREMDWTKKIRDLREVYWKRDYGYACYALYHVIQEQLQVLQRAAAVAREKGAQPVAMVSRGTLKAKGPAPAKAPDVTGSTRLKIRWGGKPYKSYPGSSLRQSWGPIRVGARRAAADREKR